MRKEGNIEMNQGQSRDDRTYENKNRGEHGNAKKRKWEQ